MAAALSLEDLQALWLAVVRKRDPVMAKLMDDGIIPLAYPSQETMVDVLKCHQACENGHRGQWRLVEGEAVCCGC